MSYPGMNPISFSFSSIRNKSIPVIFAVLLYLLPNLFQDGHRIFAHHKNTFSLQVSGDKNIHTYIEKCPVCVFEFYSVDEVKTNIFAAILATSNSIFNLNVSHQLSLKVFDYSQLRAPPVS